MTRILLIAKGLKVCHAYNIKKKIQRDLSSYLKRSRESLSVLLKRSKWLFYRLETIDNFISMNSFIFVQYFNPYISINGKCKRKILCISGNESFYSSIKYCIKYVGNTALDYICELYLNKVTILLLSILIF